MIDIRLRSTISPSELKQKIGKIITPADYNVVLTGPSRVTKPDGSLLCVYLPGALTQIISEHEHVRPVFRSLRNLLTDNRGEASGTQRVRHGVEKRTRSKKVASTMIGAFDPTPSKNFCRQSAWTSKHMERFLVLRPFFQAIAAEFKQHVPQRYEAQMRWVEKTDPAWIIPGTPFTTITVNNSYPTGVHCDKGDLEEGFSTLAVLRQGEMSGGLLSFVPYRVAVDMQDGDLMLMDAHTAHGNTAIVKGDGAERISVVSYFRKGMVKCGTAEREYQRAVKWAESRGGLMDDD